MLYDVKERLVSAILTAILVIIVGVCGAYLACYIISAVLGFSGMLGSIGT